MVTPPDGFSEFASRGAFAKLVGPFFAGPGGVIGVQAEDRHLNAAGSVMGGFLATLVDVAFGHAIREGAEGGASVATVSLTVDYLRPGPAGAWLEARTEVERLGGKLAFADCSVRAGDQEIVRARAVFAVRQRGD